MTIRFQPKQQVRRITASVSSGGGGIRCEWITDTVQSLADDGAPIFRAFDEKAEDWREGAILHVLASPIVPNPKKQLRFPPIVTPIDRGHQLTTTFSEDPEDFTLRLSVDTPWDHEGVAAVLKFAVAVSSDGSLSVLPTMTREPVTPDHLTTRCSSACENPMCGDSYEGNVQRIIGATMSGALLTILSEANRQDTLNLSAIKERVYNDMAEASLLAARDVVQRRVMDTISGLVSPTPRDVQQFGGSDDF